MNEAQPNNRVVMAVCSRAKTQARFSSTEDLIQATASRMGVVLRLGDDDEYPSQQTAKRLSDECDKLEGDCKRTSARMQQQRKLAFDDDDDDDNIRQRAGELVHEPRGLEVLQNVDSELPQALTDAIDRSVAAAAQQPPLKPPNNDEMREVEGELQRQREVDTALAIERDAACRDRDRSRDEVRAVAAKLELES